LPIDGQVTEVDGVIWSRVDGDGIDGGGSKAARALDPGRSATAMESEEKSFNMIAPCKTVLEYAQGFSSGADITTHIGAIAADEIVAGAFGQVARCHKDAGGVPRSGRMGKPENRPRPAYAKA
jgi:hypothetical protein